ncbi:MAG: hypothetical protein JWO54_306 [Candidatus Saccharibacteria bacterium]|nr:hypothetical protein [Candidatus Saccharibacteria bacterium]MDB5180548.1 hypothetical protein [Candidatus Saccharibacteria bacterium]
MSELIPDNFESEPASEMTVAYLVSVLSEYALNGGHEKNDFRSLIFQNDDKLEDRRLLFVTKYFTAEGEEVPIGEKVGDILIYDAMEVDAKRNPIRDDIWNFTNFYIVNEGVDEHGDPVYRIEKNRLLQCRVCDLADELDKNARSDNPVYQFENMLGIRTVSESEAFELAKMITEKIVATK